MPFCYSPWTNLDIDPAGNITPCCKFQRKYYTETFNIQTNSIEKYLDSNLLRSVKQEFDQGQWPAGCERCRIEEKNGIPSKRQLDWERWHQHYKNYDRSENKFLTASVAFGNTCNLKCITCNSYSSSRWQQEYREIYQIDHSHVQFYRQDFVERFTELAPGLMHLDVPGGEPFISGVSQQQALLQYYINIGRASDMTLHYTTNATIFPDQSWWKLWNHFKEIDLQLSIDGIESRYEYIRFPAKWNTLVKNVDQYLDKQLHNFKLSVSHTVSAYNIYYLDEFFNWCQTTGLPRPWLGRVHTPSHMRPTVWPQKIRVEITDHLKSSSHNDVKIWANHIANTDDSAMFDTFKIKLHEHDRHRNLDFKSVFPEMAPHV